MLVDKVCHHGGVALTSDYSGIGQPEYVMRRIKQWLVEKGYVPQIRLHRSCDMLPHARMALIEAGGDDECVLGNMLARAPRPTMAKINVILTKHRLLQRVAVKAAATKKEKKKAKHASEKAYLLEVKELFQTEEIEASDLRRVLVGCFKHGRMCPAYGPLPAAGLPATTTMPSHSAPRAYRASIGVRGACLVARLARVARHGLRTCARC